MLPFETPYHKFDLPTDIDNIEKLFVTYAQRGMIRIEKTLEDVQVLDHNTVMVHLSQEDTSHINGEDRVIEAQVTALTKDGNRFTGRVVRIKTGKVLKKEVIR